VSNAGSNEVERNLAHELELGWNKNLVLSGLVELSYPKRKQNNQKQNNQKSNQNDSVYGKWGALE
jgi:hypothetical protein